MKVRVLTLVAFFAFGLTVCRDKKVVEAEKIVNEWIEKTVIFNPGIAIFNYSLFCVNRITYQMSLRESTIIAFNSISPNKSNNQSKIIKTNDSWFFGEIMPEKVFCSLRICF